MNTAHGYIARDVYRRMTLGDRIADNELLLAYPYFEHVANVLYPLGDTFRLQAHEANRAAYTLRGYAKARGLIND